MARVVPLQAHHATHLKLHYGPICFKSKESRRKPAQVRQVPDQHELPGLALKAHQHGLDVIVRCDTGYLSYPLSRAEPRRQDFSGLLGSQFLAVLNPVEGKVERRQEIRGSLDCTPAFVAQAAPRIFCLGLGGSVLDEIE